MFIDNIIAFASSLLLVQRIKHKTIAESWSMTVVVQGNVVEEKEQTERYHY